MDWYRNIYRTHDPAEIASRCNLPFDGASFTLRIMGRTCLAGYPEYSLLQINPAAAGNNEIRGFEKILFLRYLCEGRYAKPTGRQLSYREVPWGDLYFNNFENRCIKRLAGKFGNNVETFKKIMEEKLNAEKLDKSDAGYRFEFSSGLYMSFLLWAADDEFPASAQILFDDNFPMAFTAEDMAAAGDIAINHLC